MFQRAAVGAGCAAVMAWATNAVIANNALATMTPVQFLALEFTAASVVLAVALAVKGSTIARGGDSERVAPARAVRLRLRLAPFVLGLTGIVGTVVLQAAAFTYAPVIKANLLACSWPLPVAFWCVATSQILRPRLYLMFVAIGLFGVWLMLEHGASDSGDHPAWGYLFAAGSALCMACYTVAAGSARLSVARAQLPAVSAGAVLFLAIAIADSIPWPSWNELLRPIYLGCVPMAAGYALWTYANARGQPAWIAPLGYLTPALSTIFLIVNDTRSALSDQEILGIGLVLTCTAVAGYLTRTSRPTVR